MKSFSIVCVFLALLFLVYTNPIEAGRVLHIKNDMNDLKNTDFLVFQSLPKGPVTPSGPSGCTYIPGSNGRPYLAGEGRRREGFSALCVLVEKMGEGSGTVEEMEKNTYENNETHVYGGLIPESRDTSTPNLTMNSSTIVFRIHPTSLNRLKSVPVAEGSSKTTTEGYMKTYKNVSQGIQDQLNAEAEAVKIILTGKDNDIYSTVDACPNACEMWKAIERFYKMMNELVRNPCDVTNHQVNVQFLLQLQPEWKRFVTLVKQSQELKTVSYHKLYDILKRHQNEVNKIRAERLACTANTLAFVTQQRLVYHPQSHPTHYTQNSSTSSQPAATRNRGKVIVSSSTPTYDQEPALVADDDEMSKEKEIDKLMALNSLSFKKIYKPTNNNLITANQDNSPRINRGTGYDNQRVVNVAGARDNVGTQVVQKYGIQCYNCKEYGHWSTDFDRANKNNNSI
nr:hypothetical protein [Tanacetum cinerariifolium]